MLSATASQIVSPFSGSEAALLGAHPTYLAMAANGHDVPLSLARQRGVRQPNFGAMSFAACIRVLAFLGLNFVMAG
jgi:hypothetical protein